MIGKLKKFLIENETHTIENTEKKYAEIETKNTAALAIEMGADAVDIGKTIHPNPTLGESIGMAAEVAHGSCTDVPPARK